MTQRLISATALILFVAAPGATTPDPARTFLSTAFNPSAADVGRIARGEVIARTLETTNRREVATLGIVRIMTSPLKYVERLADIAAFKRTGDVLQVGKFSDVPQLGDVASLTVDDADLKRLRECRVEDCAVQLSAQAIERITRGFPTRTICAGCDPWSA